MARDQMINNKILTLLPGKSGQDSMWLPLWIHGEDTKHVMTYLMHNWVPRQIIETLQNDACISVECLEQTLSFIGLIHDIGKITPAFLQRIIPRLPEIREQLISVGVECKGNLIRTEKSPHGIAGEAILLSEGCQPGIASVVGAHHGKPRERTINSFDGAAGHIARYEENFFGRDGAESCEGQMWATIRREWLAYAMEDVGIDNISMLPVFSQKGLMILSGLLIMADWIASNTAYYPLISINDFGLEIDSDRRSLFAMQQLKLPLPWLSERFTFSKEDFTSAFHFSPNAVQQAVLEAVQNAQEPGIFILEAQMGCGKTEAALAAAEVLSARKGGGGIFFGLPTQATANGMFSRLLLWAKQQADDTEKAIRLAHGMASLNEEYQSLFCGSAQTEEDAPESGLMVHEWFSGRKQALLADFVIGTVDQLLMAALKQRHVALRHLGLAGKVVIIDECHAYDAYMSVYLDGALRWLGDYGVPVILLSATLPTERRNRLIDAYQNRHTVCDEYWRETRAYPVLTWTDGDRVCQKIIPPESNGKAIQILNAKDENVAELLQESLHDGCAGIIVNTVARAQSFAEAVQASIPDAEVILLHSHFVATDRSTIEQKVLRQIGRESTAEMRCRRIIVGTQILEQSLDIDFDLLITDLCPMDLLLQRIGRLQRHNRPERADCFRNAVCYVLGADGDELEEGSRKVYGDWLLHRTKSILPSEVVLPNDIQRLVQDTYEGVVGVTEVERVMYEQYKRDLEDKKTRAQKFLLKSTSVRRKKAAELTGILDTDVSDTKRQGELSVRDSAFSIQVLVMVKGQENQVRFLPWHPNGGVVAADHVPSDEEARQIASQRVTLPYVFNVGKNGDETIRELERRNKEGLPEWQRSSWLQGELILLLDETLSTQLLQYEIHYTEKEGLTYARKNGSDNGSRV